LSVSFTEDLVTEFLGVEDLYAVILGLFADLSYPVAIYQQIWLSWSRHCSHNWFTEL